MTPTDLKLMLNDFQAEVRELEGALAECSGNEDEQRRISRVWLDLVKGKANHYLAQCGCAGCGRLGVELLDGTCGDCHKNAAQRAIEN